MASNVVATLAKVLSVVVGVMAKVLIAAEDTVTKVVSNAVEGMEAPSKARVLRLQPRSCNYKYK